jgi:hypothetical protein
MYRRGGFKPVAPPSFDIDISLGAPAIPQQSNPSMEEPAIYL